MSKTPMSERSLPPVLLLSHGTPMLAGEQSHIRDYWNHQGDEALRYGIKGVVIMGAHWSVTGHEVRVAANPTPNPESIALVKRSDYDGYKPNPDLSTAKRCVQLLREAGFEAAPDPDFDWLIDTFPLLWRMFPAGCPPVTVVSQNVYYEPHFHIAIGRALRPLRKEGYLLIGSGGGVHNLYRADYTSNWLYRDAFAQRYPPDATHLEFRQALEDVLCKNGAGPELKSAVVRLMKHPNYRDAHGTDDHYMPTCFIAGVVGEEEDRGEEATLACEMWELKNQGETQFIIGTWPSKSISA